MLQVINITDARANLSRLIDDVVRTGEPKILIRESKPQAVVIPYSDYLKTEEQWKNEFSALMKKNQKAFKRSLKKKGIKYPTTEEGMYGLIETTTGRR